jgi:hypothetical protein
MAQGLTMFAVLTGPSTYNAVSDIFYILSILCLIGGAILVIKSRIPQLTIKNLQQLNDTYEKRITALEEKIKEDAHLHVENTKAIANLQGQIKIYKELPLQALADGMERVVEISKVNADSNAQILKVLQTTSRINAEDRDVLTNQNQHIKTAVHKIMNKNIETNR